MYQQFADIATRKDVERMLLAAGMPPVKIPELRGGKPEIVVCKLTDAQRAMIGNETHKSDDGSSHYEEGSILYRLDNLPKNPGKGEDNILVIISDLRKVALDAKVFMPGIDASGGKIPACAENVWEEYELFKEDLGTQLIFLDYSTPKSEKTPAWVKKTVQWTIDVEEGEREDATEAAIQKADIARDHLENLSPTEIDEALGYTDGGNWSAYQHIRGELIEKGIHPEEIAFIHDWDTPEKREDLFGRVRSGRVRVLMGSTSKMGPGMNVQNRMTALHNLDAPWRPSDLEQRNGRLIRQGNELLEKYGDAFKVRLCYYVTEDSGEAGMYDVLERKAKFIEQLRNDDKARTAEDPESAALDPGRIKALASGNAILMDHVILTDKVKKLELLRRGAMEEIRDRERSRNYAINSIEHIESGMANLTESYGEAVEAVNMLNDLRVEAEQKAFAEKERRAEERRAATELRRIQKENEKAAKKAAKEAAGKSGNTVEEEMAAAQALADAAAKEASDDAINKSTGTGEGEAGTTEHHGFVPFTPYMRGEAVPQSRMLTAAELGEQMNKVFSAHMSRSGFIPDEGLLLGEISGIRILLVKNKNDYRSESSFSLRAETARGDGVNGQGFSFSTNSHATAGSRALKLIQLMPEEFDPERAKRKISNLRREVESITGTGSELDDESDLIENRERLAAATFALRTGFKTWQTFVAEIEQVKRSGLPPRDETLDEKVNIERKEAALAKIEAYTEVLGAARKMLSEQEVDDDQASPQNDNEELMVA